MTPLIALAAVACSVWQSATRPAVAPDPTSEAVTFGLAAYRDLITDLPPSGDIGFIPTTTNPTFTSANHFVAQYALAPRLLLNPFGAGVQFVITGVNGDGRMDGHPALSGYELAAVRNGGIRVYRRKAP